MPRVLAPVEQAARFLSAKARREGQDVFLVWLCFGDKKVCQSEKASHFKTLTSTVSQYQEKTKSNLLECPGLGLFSITGWNVGMGRVSPQVWLTTI